MLEKHCLSVVIGLPFDNISLSASWVADSLIGLSHVAISVLDTTMCHKQSIRDVIVLASDGCMAQKIKAVKQLLVCANFLAPAGGLYYVYYFSSIKCLYSVT